MSEVIQILVAREATPIRREPAVNVRVREPGPVRGGMPRLVVGSGDASAVRVIAAMSDEVRDRPELRPQQEHGEQDGTSRLPDVPDCRAALPHIDLEQDDEKHQTVDAIGCGMSGAT